MTRSMRVRVELWIGLCAAATVALAQDQAERAPQALSPLVVESLAPVLARWIESERDAAKAQGVEPIPAAIRASLEGYVPKAVLDRVRWREGASELSLPQNMIRFGHASAVTLDDVIVFEDNTTAVEDPKFWAHEIKHVMQFEEWGVEGFAARYLSDSQAVENEAWEYRWQFMKQAGLIPPVPPPSQ
ncbi:MAG TPA: DUF4157 domain-containing protein [Gammaproteobacteria bacterium]